jgi:DNA polymerase-3 subunit alpha
LSFVHLHNHSDYSLLDGAIKTDTLIDGAKNLNMPAVALTDHGNMFGAIEFYLKGIASGVKPIIGIEAYLSPEEELTFSGGQPTLYHIILLVKDKRGYQNLMKLSSLSFTNGFYYKPRITRKWLAEYKEGLVCLSACVHGEVASLLSAKHKLGAKEAVNFYRSLFSEDFYLEAQNHGLKEESAIRSAIYELGREMKVKVVATNDCHYLKREHYKPHDILLCIQTGKNLSDSNRLKYETDQLYFKSEAEMREAFTEFPEALDHTMEVADKCNLMLDFKGMHLPKFPLPEGNGFNTVAEYLAKNTWETAKCRYGENPPREVKDRLEYELETIDKMGFSGYFLIVKDFTDFARAHKIAVGPARGSAAGSLVSFCLGITNIDPLKYGLLFERFLNPERVSLPDIDIDFADDRRDEVIQYVRQKYGEKNVTQIITFGKMMARAVVRDVGRVLGLPYGEVDKIAKRIPNIIGMTLDKALNEVPELKELISSNPAYEEMMTHCLTLEGLNRHAGTHAAGVVVAPDELTKFMPLYRMPDGNITSQYDMNILEFIGLLKMDFLGLKTLTVIEKTLMLLANKGIRLDLNSLPLDNKETYRLFQEGRTVGVFQFESPGMREYLKKLKPESLEDLTAMNALYRPGPMQFIDDFIRRKHGQAKIQYLHPQLKPILEETYGVIVYQEQVIRITHDIAGFTLGKADQIRRAMGKKKPGVMDALSHEFIEGMIANGIEEKLANSIFEMVERFARYGFNKSHAVGYALIAYQTAYLKTHYPAEFLAATMSSEMSRDSSRFMILVDECKKAGVEVLPPDVNESDFDFTVSGNKIRFGLGAVKNVGENPVKSILETRKVKGNFTDIYHFIEDLDQRMVNRKVLESLIQAGAFDSIEHNRARLMASVDSIVSYGEAMSEERERGQISFFGGDSASVMSFAHPAPPEVEEWNRFDKLGREKEMLGFYVSGHPLEKFRREVEELSSPTIEGVDNVPDNTNIRICGIITSVKRQLTKKGDMMAIVAMEDFTGSVEILFFQKAMDNAGKLLVLDNMVVLKGKTSTKEDEKVKIIADTITPLDQALSAFTSSIQLTVKSSDMSPQKIAKLDKILNAHSGAIPVRLLVYSGSEIVRLKTKKTVTMEDGLLKDLEDLLGANSVKLLM